MNGDGHFRDNTVEGEFPVLRSADRRVKTTESRYAFRRELETVHRADRCDPAAQPLPGEIVIDSTWRVVIEPQPPRGLRHIAEDLADYFSVSMNVDIATAPGAHDGQCTITLAIDPEIHELQGSATRSYLIDARSERITIVGRDMPAVAQGAYFLEDLLNLRRAPYLRPFREVRSPAFAPRMTHSGWGLDEYPDGYLSQIAHAGMDSVVVFASGPDRVPDETTHRSHDRNSPRGRYRSFSALADRAAEYGLDVYLYAYVGNGPVHPQDPGAHDHYATTYGSLIAACPQAKGIVLVGESVEFPSHDSRTTGRLHTIADPDGLPSEKPSPGWWPCDDYPEWVALVADVCRAHNPDLEVVFWTYNWGWAPAADRARLLRTIPADITVQATFEMFEPIDHDGVTNMCVDYTAAVAGPGRYFRSEAEIAHGRGMKLFAMSNTGGLTWDFGVIPYQPIPQQWAARHRALVQARRDWGLSGLMESHHYGWWPSFVSDLAKWSFWTPSLDAESAIERIAERDFGPGAPAAIRAWQSFSDAARQYVPTNADQYGPFRIGPAYPLTLFTTPHLVVDSHAMFGDRIVAIPYEPDQVNSVVVTPNSLRIHGELASLSRMLQLWEAGCQDLAVARSCAPEYRRPAADRLEGLVAFMASSIRTTIHTKQWWLKKAELLVCSDRSRALALVDELHEIGEAEHHNATKAITYTDADSRLGWEPSMGYIGDTEHIRWKLAHLDHVLAEELPAYRRGLAAIAAGAGA